MYLYFSTTFILSALPILTLATSQNSTTHALAPRDTLAFTASDLTINIWDKGNCQGHLNTTTNLMYGYNNHMKVGSFNTSRPLNPGKQLDFSTVNPGQTVAGADGIDFMCDHFATSVGTETGTKCTEFSAGLGVWCFRFWHH